MLLVSLRRFHFGNCRDFVRAKQDIAVSGSSESFWFPLCVGKIPSLALERGDLVTDLWGPDASGALAALVKATIDARKPTVASKVFNMKGHLSCLPCGHVCDVPAHANAEERHTIRMFKEPDSAMVVVFFRRGTLSLGVVARISARAHIEAGWGFQM